MTTWYFVRPADTLFVRGNLTFGEAGEHGTGLMPPAPSVFAGAFRSALLGLDARQLADFTEQGRVRDTRLADCLGTPRQPGKFRVGWLSLAGVRRGKEATPEALLSPPADLLWLGDGGFAPLMPRVLPVGVTSAGELPLRATLHTPKQAKPEGGRYLALPGWSRHLKGERPDSVHAVPISALHQRDPRLGIGLNPDSRTVDEGHLYTTEGHAFHPPGSVYAETGFLVGLEGVNGLLPERGHLRLGGDGRSAEYRRVRPDMPGFDTAAIERTRRFRLILQTPGLFGDAAWLPPGVVRDPSDGAYRLCGPGFTARLQCAAVGRREVVSGWDLHLWKPKSAESAVPAGSVYWFDEFSGDVGKLAEWAAGGLRLDTAAAATPRHAEGWNQAQLALWPNG
jgi:CRISPR-associated protein Cmr3